MPCSFLKDKEFYPATAVKTQPIRGHTQCKFILFIFITHFHQFKAHVKGLTVVFFSDCHQPHSKHLQQNSLNSFISLVQSQTGIYDIQLLGRSQWTTNMAARVPEDYKNGYSRFQVKKIPAESRELQIQLPWLQRTTATQAWRCTGLQTWLLQGTATRCRWIGKKIKKLFT